MPDDAAPRATRSTAPEAASFGDRAAELAVIAVAAIAAGATRLVPLSNPDVLWQARTGDLVLASGRRVATDAFSRFLRGQPIHDHEPLWEALVALADRTAPRLLTLWWANLALAVIALTIATHVAGRTVRAPWARLAGAMIVVIAVSQRLELRAEAATFAAIAIAHGVRRGGDGLARRLAPLAVAATAVLFHGLAWLVCVVPFAWGVDALARRRGLRQAAIDGAVGLGTIGLTELVMPGTLRNVFANARGKAFADHIIEGYTPLQIYEKTQNALPFLTLGATALVLAGLALLLRSGRARVADVALVAVLALPGVRWSRFLAMPLLATLPWAIAAVAAIFESGLRPTRAWLRWSAAVMTVPIALGLAAMEVAEYGSGARHGGFEWRRQPVAALSWVRKNRPDARLFHAYNHGAYVIYTGFPAAGAVIDARAATVYPDAYADRYYAALADPAAFDRWMEEAGFDTILLARHGKSTDRVLRHLEAHATWRKAYEDQGTFVFARGP